MTTTGDQPLGLSLSEGLGVPAMHPPLPTPAAWNCYWKGDNDGPSWDQWHDASDPMPENWDSDPPDDVVPYFTSTQVFDYAGQCVKDATAECSAHWQAKTEVLARWMADALGALCDVNADAEDGGESLRMLKDQGERLVRAVLTSTPNAADEPDPTAAPNCQGTLDGCQPLGLGSIGLLGPGSES